MLWYNKDAQMYHLRTLLLISLWFFLSCGNSSTDTPSAITFPDTIKDYFVNDPDWSIFRTADSLKWSREYRNAASAFEDILEKQPDLDNNALAYGLNQLAYCYLRTEETEAASKILFELGFDFSDTTLSSNNLATYYLNKGIYYQKTINPKKSIHFFKQVLNISKQIHGVNQYYERVANTELSLVYKYMTTHVDSFLFYADKSYELLSQAIDISFYKPQIYYANAHACWIRRSHDEGENICNLAIQTIHSSPNIDTLLLARCLSLKSRFSKKKKKSEQIVLATLTQALKLGESIKGKENQILHRNLLNYYARKGDSIKLFNQLSLLEKKYESEEFFYVNPSRLKGLYYYYNKNFDKAIKWYTEFLKKYLSNEIYESAILEECYFLLVKSYQNIKQLKKAEEYAWKLIALRFDKDINELTWEDLFNLENAQRLHVYVGYHLLANIYRQNYEANQDKNALKKAFQLYKFIDELIYVNIDSFDENAWLDATKSYNTGIYNSALETSYYLSKIEQNKEVLEYANWFIERMKSSLFFREYLHNLDSLTILPPNNLITKEKKINTQLRKLRLRENGDIEQLNSLLKRQTSLIEEVQKNYPTYFKIKINHPLIKLSNIQKKIHTTNSVIFNYLVQDSNIFLCFIHPDTTILHKIESKKQVEKNVKWLKKFISGQDHAFLQSSQRQYIRIAHQVYNQLIAPINRNLLKDKKIIIIPDGFLYNFSFDTLLTDNLDKDKFGYKDLPFLIKKNPLIYTFSIKNWLSLERNNPLFENPSILGYAFSKSTPIIEKKLRSSINNSIPGTGAELDSIKKILRPSRSLFRYGKDATINNFLENIEHGQYDILHLALHGKSNNVKRGENILYFPGNPIDSIFGFNLINHQLNSRLVVLASCETATGIIEKGEGTYSITRTFLLAGAEAVVSSFWAIDDYSTSKLIAQFYRALHKNHIVSDALQKAKINYLYNTSEELSHPYYWSGLGYFGV